MRKGNLLIGLLALAALSSCSPKSTIKLPDYKDIIDDNTARIELLEANDAVQDMRLDVLEQQVADLETELADVEARLSQAEADIIVVFDELDTLSDDLSDLRDELRREVARLDRADRATRRMIRRKIRRLRRRLAREIRDRRVADRQQQRQIDSLERQLDRFEARQRVLNRYFLRSLRGLNRYMAWLQRSIQRQLNRLSRGQHVLRHRVGQIRSDVRALRRDLRNLTQRVSDVETQLQAQEVAVEDCGGDDVLSIGGRLYGVVYELETKTIALEVDGTVPEHFVCDAFWGGSGIFSNLCYDGHMEPASPMTSTGTATITVINSVKLEDVTSACTPGTL